MKIINYLKCLLHNAISSNAPIDCNESLNNATEDIYQSLKDSGRRIVPEELPPYVALQILAKRDRAISIQEVRLIWKDIIEEMDKNDEEELNS